MALIDRETELKLAELEEETDLIEYSSQTGEDVQMSHHQAEKWVEKHQTTFEEVPQMDQLNYSCYHGNGSVCVTATSS